ncbi:MAG: hypothetical protein ACKO5K_00975 [Armatimonadota bacterium]
MSSAFLLLFVAGIVTSAPQTPPIKPSAEAVRARDAIADIILLQSIVPLKLRASQIDRLLPLMKAAQEEAVRQLKLDDEALKTVEPFLTKLRTGAVSGTLPSADDEKKVADTNAEMEKRFAEARRKAVADLLAVSIAVLDETQKNEVQKQSDSLFGGKRVPKKYAANPSKAPRNEVEALALAAYVERVLLIDRAIPLFESLRATAR